MRLERRAVKESGYVLGNGGDVGLDTDEASPSGTVCTVSGCEDVLVWEEGGRDLFDNVSASSWSSETVIERMTYLKVIVDIDSTFLGQSRRIGLCDDLCVGCVADGDKDKVG